MEARLAEAQVGVEAAEVPAPAVHIHREVPRPIHRVAAEAVGVTLTEFFTRNKKRLVVENTSLCYLFGTKLGLAKDHSNVSHNRITFATHIP